MQRLEIYLNADIFQVKLTCMDIFGVNIQTVIVELVLTSVLLFFWKRIGTLLVKIRSKFSDRYNRMQYTKTAESDTTILQVVVCFILVMTVFVASLILVLEVIDAISTTGGLVGPDESSSTGFFLYRIFPYIFIGIAVVTNLVALEFFTRHAGIYTRIVDFQHKLKIIRASISDEEFYRIEQQWALMKSEEDHNAIWEILKKHIATAKKEVEQRKKKEAAVERD